ncbi:Annexin [Aspergillus ellipticus CBS 707.79]|uniref:Annexin n=1 Tax=Aspergillus ellipticus CBS 707.79 TaxID=1448320 RepID=A0A319D882_9EURO|nr:Annexin [Aspergillus ellipticus CBS 707.79]
MNPYPPSNCPPAPPGPPGPNNYPPQFQPGPPGPQGPIPPSPGYDPTYIPTGNAAAEADALRKAMKGFGTDEKILINILTSTTSPTQMSLIQQTFNQRHNRSLEKDLTSETSGSFKRAVVMLATGPLASDVTYLHEAMHGMGTDEDALNDVLLGRSNADLTAIKHAYAQKYGKSLVDAVRGELSGKTERFFVMLLDARRPENVYFDPQGVESDVRELHRSSKAQAGTDEVGAFSVFVNSSDQRLVAVAREFERVYHVALEEVIRDEFSGHLKSALLGMLGLAKDKVAFYAGLLKEALFVDEECVDKGRLAYWVVRLHWDPRLFGAVKGFMRGELSAMVRRRVDSGESSKSAQGFVITLVP